jgi:hypothetical protein
LTETVFVCVPGRKRAKKSREFAFTGFFKIR